MRYLRLSFLLSFLLLIYSGCDNDDPDTFNEPYFTIDVDARGYEEWIFITNTSGGLVGYKQIPKEGVSIQLTKRIAPLSGQINVYVMGISQDGLKRSFFCNAYLGLETGQTYRNKQPLPQGRVNEINSDVRVAYAPKSAVFHWSPTLGTTRWIAWDTTYFEGKKITSNRDLVACFTAESMMYADIENVPNPQKFRYPDDFKEYDHQIEVPTGINPSGIVTSAIDPGMTYFMLVYSTTDFEKLEFNKTIKLCYLNGFDTYFTSYNLGTKSFVMNGDIPTVEEASIPDYDVSVTNKSLFNFSADVPAEISHRRSTYNYEEAMGGKQNIYRVSVYSVNASAYQFDLSLPKEFRDAYSEISFSDFEYGGTTFEQTSIQNGYKNVVLRQLDNTLVPLEGYTYTYYSN